MSVHDRTLSVIQSFYDAAMDESLWRASLKGLCDLTGSQAASFWVLDGSEQPRLPTFICINFDMESIAEYLDYWAAEDPTVKYLVAHPQQPIVHDGLVITEREKDKHPYYDWHEKRIDTRFRMVGQTRVLPSVQAGVAVHRTRKAGRYDPKEIDRFAILHGHMERAVGIGFRLGTLGTMQRATAEWLDQNPAAVLFLDEHKKIVFANRTARLFEAEKDGLKLMNNCISLLHRRDNEKLQGLLEQVASRAGSHITTPGGVMRARRPSGKRPYGITIGPVSRQGSVFCIPQPSICVVIHDPEQQAKLPSQHLQSAFGLTEAEARLATLLAEGTELRVAAETLGITYGSARTRLAEIFQKTETKRQGELIRLLLTTIGHA
jgi:DNA-binding CsgD family transcriptional regulator